MPLSRWCRCLVALLFYFAWSAVQGFVFEAVLSPRVSLNVTSFQWSEFSLLKWHYAARTLVTPSRAETHGIDLSSQSIELAPPPGPLNLDLALYWSASSAVSGAPWLYVANAQLGAFSVSRVGASFWIKNLQQDSVVVLSLSTQPDVVFSIRQFNASALAFSLSLSSPVVLLAFNALPDYSLTPKGNVFSLGRQPGLVLFWIRDPYTDSASWTYLDFPSVPVVPCRLLPLPPDSPVFLPGTNDSLSLPYEALSLPLPMVFATDADWSFGWVDIYSCSTYAQRFSLSYQANSSRSLSPAAPLQWIPL